MAFLNIGEGLTYLSVTIFVFGMVVFAIFYRRVLLQTIAEYEQVIVILKRLMVHLQRQRSYGRGISSVQRTRGMSGERRSTDQEGRKVQKVENTLEDLTGLLQNPSASNRRLITQVMNVQIDVKKLMKSQEALQRRINRLDDKIHQTQVLKRNEMLVQSEESQQSRITNTEQVILNLLLVQGSMTTPKIEKEVGKTREHTARLMNKLWKAGYVERDTQRKPFTYRLTKNFKKNTVRKKAEKVTSTITKTPLNTQTRSR
jgi:DNA-binding MarR family transcriptional regulator